MDQQNGLYFTIWYGVFHKPSRRIDYSGGGHPPALLIDGLSADGAPPLILDSKGPMIGAMTDMEYESGEIQIGDHAKIYMYSDGAYELELPDQTMWPFDDFLAYMGKGPFDDPANSKLDALIAHDRQLMGRDEFADDLSVVELTFAPQ